MIYLVSAKWPPVQRIHTIYSCAISGMFLMGGGGGGDQTHAEISKSDADKKMSCSMCVRGPLLPEKKIRGALVEKWIGGAKSKEISYKKQVMVGSYIQLQQSYIC